MSRHTNLVFACLLVLCSAGSAQEAKSFAHAGTGLVFPEKLAGLSLGERTVFKTGSGHPDTAIPYHGENVEATIFVTPREGEMNYPNAIAAVAASLEGVREMERRGHYTEVKITEAAPDSQSPAWAQASFSGIMNGRPAHSFVCATFTHGHVVKLRISTPVAGELTVFRFISELKKLVGNSKE